MNPGEYLDAAKKTMGITSDNELAKRLETTRQRISAYRLGQQSISPETAFKLAITLNLDPALVFADLESQREKNPKRQEFWKSFLSRATLAAVLVCTLAFSSIGISERAAGGIGGTLLVSAALFWAFRLRIICIM